MREKQKDEERDMMKKQTNKSKDKGHANERDCIKKRMILGVIEMRVKEVRKICRSV